MKKIVSFCLLMFIGCCSMSGLAQKKLSEPDQLNFESAFFEALKQKAIGNYDKAIEPLEVCYNLDSTNVAVLFELSKNFLWQRKYFESKQNINKALKLEPKNIWLWQQAKSIAIAQQNYNQALNYQQKIVTLNPSKKIGFLNLYLITHNKEKALALLDVLEKEQGLNRPLKRIRNKLLGRDIKLKISSISQATSGLTDLKTHYQKTGDFKFLKQILALESNQKNYKALKQDAVKALDLFPSQAVLYLYAAQANNALKNYNEAVLHLQNGIDFVIDNPTKKTYYLAFYKAYNGLNNQKKANYYKKLANQL